jgi:hypothetical protein
MLAQLTNKKLNTEDHTLEVDLAKSSGISRKQDTCKIRIFQIAFAAI